MKRLLAGLLLVVGAACGGPDGPAVGRVTDREYDDPDDYYISGYTISGPCSGGYDNVPRTCGPDIHIPGYWQHDGPQWKLKLKAGEGETEREGWRSVSEATYDRCELGTWCDTTE